MQIHPAPVAISAAAPSASAAVPAPAAIPAVAATSESPATSASSAIPARSASGLRDAVAAAVTMLAAVPPEVELYRLLDDPALLDLAGVAAEGRRYLDTITSLAAGEVARRSAPTLGSSGLAQRTGYRTPEELVRVTTQTSKRDAGTAVRVGQVLQDLVPMADPVTGEVPVSSRPWLAPVAAAVAAGRVGVAAAESISNGLGTPTGDVTVDALRAAAVELVAAATSLDPDRVFTLARQARDLLDEAGVGDRERQRYEKRSLRVSRLPDGLTRVVWVLDAESAVIVTDLYDRATSPRRGGPRFVADPGTGDPDADLAETILEDTRTPEQLASDVFLHLLHAGADADDRHLLGTGATQVTVLVTKDTLDGGQGHGYLTGHPDPVSVRTVERHQCDGITETITLDQSGQPVDVTAELRFFPRRIRRALAARDGGCRFPGCDRPASWTEAHHITHWSKGGKTTIVNGILLCRHHHLLIHNNGWDIVYEPVPGTPGDTDYWLIPPADLDPRRQRRPMPSKSPVWNDTRRAAG